MSGTTSYLRLRIPDNATPDTTYNLNRIDSLAQNMADQLDGSVTLRSPTDITVEPQAAARGGAGAGGTVNVGTASHAVALQLYTSSLNVSSAAGLLDQASGGSKYLRLRYKSDVSGGADTTADRILSVDPQAADRSVVLGGDLTLAGAFSTAGAFALTLTQTGATNVTLPTAGTLATLGGTELLSAKTLASPDVTGSLRLMAQAPVKFADADSDHFVAFKAPSSVASDVTWTLPGADGTSGQVLTTDGSGSLTWASVTTDVLNQANVRVGNASNVATPVDTSSVGDILANSSTGLTIKSSVVTNAMLAGSITYAKLSLSDGDIPVAKLATLTASRAVVTSAGGVLSAAATTATELGYLSGVTSAVQTQLDAKLPKAGGTMTGSLVLAGDASQALEPVTKQQFDAALFGLYPKAPVLVATTANITLSGEQTIDGVLTSASRVLVKTQSTTSQNGIYVSGAGAWTRASDFDSWAEVPGSLISVEAGGSVNGGSLWMCTAAASGTVGSTAISFSQVSGPGTYTADGQGLELSGSQFSLEIADSTLSKSASGVKVASGGITNTEVSGTAAIAYSKLNLVSSIATGDLAAALLVPLTKGGTGQTTAAAAFKSLAGYSAKGDFVGYDGSARGVLAVGADGTVLTADAASTYGVKWGTAFVNPMATTGDMVYGGVSGAATKLATGATAGVLHGGNGAIPSWSTIVNADVASGAAIAGSKLAAATTTTTGTVSYEDSGTFTVTFSTGLAANVSATARYSRVGKNVSIIIPSPTAGTISGNPTTINATSAIPADLRPQTLFYAFLPLGTNTPSLYEIQTGGTIRVFLNTTGTAYSNGTSWQPSPIAIGYTVA